MTITCLATFVLDLISIVFAKGAELIRLILYRAYILRVAIMHSLHSGRILRMRGRRDLQFLGICSALCFQLIIRGPRQIGRTVGVM